VGASSRFQFFDPTETGVCILVCRTPSRKREFAVSKSGTPRDSEPRIPATSKGQTQLRDEIDTSRNTGGCERVYQQCRARHSETTWPTVAGTPAVDYDEAQRFVGSFMVPRLMAVVCQTSARSRRPSGRPGDVGRSGWGEPGRI